MARAAGIAAGMMLLAGCWNGDNDTIHLGDVSIGQQMIDLKTALEQQAITQDEYDRLKSALMILDEGCGASGDE